MPEIEIQGWNKKPRTPLRSIKVGDIFMMQLAENSFGTGRILSKIDLGHVVEFFSEVLDTPVVNASFVAKAERLGAPRIVDSYSLFDKKNEGNWQIIGHQRNFQPRGLEDVYFSYGFGENCKKVDAFGSEQPVDAAHAALLPRYSPKGDLQVRSEVFGI